MTKQVALAIPQEGSFEEEQRCKTRGGKASESLSEENCPLEALRGFFFSRNSPTGKPLRGPLRGSGIFSGSGLVLPLRRCTSVSQKESVHVTFMQ